MTVRPWSLTRLWSREKMASPVALSRLPVGSSATRTLGFVIERAGDRDALHLAAGEFLRQMIGAAGETDAVEDGERGLPVGRPAQEHQRQFDVLRDGERRDERELLEDETEHAAPDSGELVFGETGDWPAVDAEFAFGRRVEAGEQIERAWSCPSRTGRGWRPSRRCGCRCPRRRAP